MEQTLTQMARETLEPKRLEFGSDISEVAAGEVVIFEFQDGEYKTRARKQLVTGKSNNIMTSLYRPIYKLGSKKAIILGGITYGDSNRLISEAMDDEVFEKDSSDIAKQRIYHALNQLLNEHRIKE